MQLSVGILGLRKQGVEYLGCLARLGTLAAVYEPSTKVLKHIEAQQIPAEKFCSSFKEFWEKKVNCAIVDLPPCWHPEILSKAKRRNLQLLFTHPPLDADLKSGLLYLIPPHLIQLSCRYLYHPMFSMFLHNVPKQAHVTIRCRVPSSLPYSKLLIHPDVLCGFATAQKLLQVDQFWKLPGVSVFGSRDNEINVVIKSQDSDVLLEFKLDQEEFEVSIEGVKWTTAIDLYALELTRVLQGGGLLPVSNQEVVYALVKVTQKLLGEKRMDAPIQNQHKPPSYLPYDRSYVAKIECKNGNDVIIERDIRVDAKTDTEARVIFQSDLQKFALANPHYKLRVVSFDCIESRTRPLSVSKALQSFF